MVLLFVRLLIGIDKDWRSMLREVRRELTDCEWTMLFEVGLVK